MNAGPFVRSAAITSPLFEISSNDHTLMEARRIVICGPMRSGKSSVINALLGKSGVNLVPTSEGALFRAKSYFATHNQRKYILYDTTGMSERTLSVKQAIKNLVILLNELQCGLHLLVYVMKRGLVKRNEEANYRLFVEAVAERQVPAVLLVTHCETYFPMDNWMNEPQTRMGFDKFRMQFVAHSNVCVLDSTLTSSNFDIHSRTLIDQMREHSVQQIWTLIEQHSVRPAQVTFALQNESSKEQALWRIWNQVCTNFNLINLRWSSSAPETFLGLCKRLGFNDSEAHELNVLLRAEEGQ